MAVNKVVMNTTHGEETLIDLTMDTVTPETLAEGVTAHAANGVSIMGTMPTTSVLYIEQTLTEEQKEQARGNIGAASAAEVNQLSEKIDEIGTQAEIVQAVIAALPDASEVSY